VGARATVARAERILRPGRGVRVRSERVAGVPVVRVTAGAEGGGSVMHLHGGAHTSGSPRTVLALQRLVRGNGPDLVSPDYRLAPEHPYPAGLHDALAVYAHLVATTGPERVVVAGESSGGGLALSMLLRARDEGLPLPAAVAVSFPWADLTLSGASSTGNDGRDVLTRRGLDAAAALYAGEAERTDPGLSPLFGSFVGFPPTLIVVGGLDLLLDDSRRLAERMREDGATVRLHEWAGCPHGFTGIPAPEGRDASRRLESFISGALRTTVG